MADIFPLLRAVGTAALTFAARSLAAQVPFGEALFDVASDAYERWTRETREEQRRLEMQAIAQAAADAVRRDVTAIVRELAADQAREVRLALAAYLSQIPASVRQPLRRVADPGGTTVPPHLVPRSAEDLLSFLPDRIPRFRAGDRPLQGVDWELTELLGVGGFGEVWKAANLRFPSIPPVALKFCLDEGMIRALHREAALLDRVMRHGGHPGIVALRQTHLDSSIPCLEFEYVAGGNLTSLIREARGREQLDPRWAARIILQLSEIVGFAHRQSPAIVHRDLKPANVLLERSGGGFRLKVADFGIGGLAAGRSHRSTSLGTFRGQLLFETARGAHTPLYASPQQARGEAPDPRDDVHAIGVLWYQLLMSDVTQGRPSGGRWRRRLTDRGMPEPLADCLASCLEDDRDDRPADARVLADQLAELLKRDREVVTAPAPQRRVVRAGLALDGSGSMASLYGVDNSVKRASESKQLVNQITPVARKLCASLAGASTGGPVACVYWGTGSGGSQIEEIGELGAEEAERHPFGPPRNWGTGTQLLPAVRHFVERYKASPWSVYMFITDGELHDLESVQAYSVQLARDIAAGRRNPLSLFLIGFGPQTNEQQVASLAGLETGTSVRLWQYRMAAGVGALDGAIAALIADALAQRGARASNPPLPSSGGGSRNDLPAAPWHR